MNDTLFLIDVYSLLFQVFHAIPSMTGPSGQPTNALFGFTRDLLYILKEKQPGYLICALDASGPNLRNDIYADYKANRSEMPEDLRQQLPVLRELIEAFRVPAFDFPGWEADDIIATIADRAAAEGIDVCIITNDKDARQLIGPRVRLLNMRKNIILDEQGLLADWGIRPDQVVDYQSLVGDSVDNVPGVPLVGPKKACALLQEYETLEAVLANADRVKGAKLQSNLKEFAEQARTSRKLVELNRNLELELPWPELKIRTPDVAKLQKLFLDCGFRRFSDEVRNLGPSRELFPNEPDEMEDRTWETIDTEEQLDSLFRELTTQKRFCFDLETTSVDARKAEIVGWAVCWKAGHSFYIPVQAPPGEKHLDAAIVAERFRPLLEDPHMAITNQNIKYEMIVLKRLGIEIRGVGLDPMVGSYLLDAGARSHGLDALAARYLHSELIPISELIGKGAKQKCMNEVPVADVSKYASEDADAALQIADLVEAELKQEKLWDLYWDLERPLIPVLAEMEFTGIRVDTDELQRQSQELGEKLNEIVAKIYELAGREFNIDSPLQLRKILFEELKLPVTKKTKTGPSTDQSVLETLAPLHELPRQITQHRSITKLRGTYLDALPQMVNAETGRIHASFNQVVAATGRLSSSDPNLQNIPIRTEEGRRVRKAFVPGEADWRLLCADYSQIELRILAHFSGDDALIEAFQNGVDIHSAVAAEVYGVPVETVTSEMRRVAKAVNFGVIYGQSSYGLANALGISKDDAGRFIQDYFRRYSGVTAFLEEVLDECLESGYATTIKGRRRAIQGIRRERPGNRNMPERTAINTVIQGSAADLIKLAMIHLHERLHNESHPARMLLQIHDELVFETPADQVAPLAAIVRGEMESALELDVPLKVDISVGENWLETLRVEE